MNTLTPAQLSTLATMLTYTRPHGSGMDHLFRVEYLHTLPGCEEDAHGNLIVRVGDSPILWSSHTDTVHRSSGWQSVRINAKECTIALSKRSRRLQNCLGADDTVGVFLMREMVLAGVPGLYVFHYGEESGGIGSSALAELTPETLNGISFAIALDRSGTRDVITSQAGEVCCSDRFAYSLAAQLPGMYAPEYGVYTDTAEYIRLIPECTNLSVGYYHQHSTREYVDYAHVGALLAALCTLDPSRLACVRDHTAVPPPRQIIGWGSYAPRVADDYGIVRCEECGEAIIPDDDWEAMLNPQFDRCVCAEDDYDRALFKDLSEEDAQFLRYLRSR